MTALQEWGGRNLGTPRHVQKSFLLASTAVRVAHGSVGTAVHVVVAAHGVFQRAAAVRSAGRHATSVPVGAVRPSIATRHDDPRDGTGRTLLSVLPRRSQPERSGSRQVDLVVDASSSGKIARCSLGAAVSSVSAAYGVPGRTATVVGNTPQRRRAARVAGGTDCLALKTADDVPLRMAVRATAKSLRQEHRAGHFSCVGRLARVRFVIARVPRWTAVFPVRTADGVRKWATCVSPAA